MTIKPNDVITDGTAKWIVKKGGDGNPVGTILAFAGNQAIPDGYLACDGSILNSDDYPALFAVVGHIYGGEIGTKQFALPQLTDSSYLRGAATAGEKQTPGLPNITGQLFDNVLYGNQSVPLLYGCFYSNSAWHGLVKQYVNAEANPSSALTVSACQLDASRFNTIYGASNDVRPHNLGIKFIIKY